MTVGNFRAIADGPHAGMVGHAAGLVDYDAAVLALFTVKLVNQRIRLDASGPDDGASGDSPPAFQFDVVRSRAGDFSFEHYLNAPLLKLPLSVLGEFGRGFRHKPVARLDEEDANTVIRDGCVARTVPDEIIKSGSRFDPGITTAAYDERQHLPPRLLVALGCGALQ